MKRIILTIFLCVLTNIGIAQLKVSKVFSASDVNLFQSSIYQETITRQNSASINLKQFLFPELRDGNYVIAMKLTLLQYPINVAKPIEKQQISILFDDVKKQLKANEPMELSLNDKVLGFNFILSDITHIKVEVRMIKLKSEYEPFMNLIKPILNIAMKETSTISLIDNVLKSISTDDDKNNLLFQAELYVPSNVFEYNNIKNTTTIPLIKNNQDFAIILEGNTPINNESLLGKGKDLVNTTTTFFVGKKVIPKESVKYSGLITINFNKEQIPVLPEIIENDLRDLDKYINGVNPIDNQDAIISLTKTIPRSTSVSLKNKEINNQAEFSINEYMKLAVIYFNMLKDNENKGEWTKQFKSWCSNIDTRGTGYGVDAIGVNEIYIDKTAKIYIPYSLNDDLLMSIYLWQNNLHTKLIEKGETGMTVKKMIVTSGQ
jgi:hypothetical protein